MGNLKYEPVSEGHYFNRCTGVDENGEKTFETYSFWGKASDCEFEDGTNLEDKMKSVENNISNLSDNMDEKFEELFQSGNDFKQGIADAIIAAGGEASADMTKDEMFNAITSLGDICIEVRKLNLRTEVIGDDYNSDTCVMSNNLYLPIYDLADVDSLIAVGYSIAVVQNGYGGSWNCLAFIKGEGDDTGYYASDLYAEIDKNNNAVLRGAQLVNLSVDTTKKFKIINYNSSYKITIASITAFIITK